MLKLHSVLFASDFSESSQNAFTLACSLARDHGAQLIVLHVVPAGTHQFLTLAQLGQGDTAEQFENNLRDDLQRHHPDDSRIPIEYRVAQGDPAESIVRIAHDTRSDIIMLGTHGRTGLKRMLMGSVAERVLRGASCSVLTVKRRVLPIEIECATAEDDHIKASIVTPQAVLS